MGRMLAIASSQDDRDIGPRMVVQSAVVVAVPYVVQVDVAPPTVWDEMPTS